MCGPPTFEWNHKLYTFEDPTAHHRFSTGVEHWRVFDNGLMAIYLYIYHLVKQACTVSNHNYISIFIDDVF